MKTVQAQDLEEVVRELKAGKVVVCPTDTVYGLLADATNQKAVQKVFLVKGREKGKPLPIFVSSIAMAKRLARVSKTQEAFLKKVWPGKVTAVLESKGRAPKELELEGKVALRIPKYPLALAVLKKLNCPITGTSANVSGQPSCFSAREVAAQFAGRKHAPDVIIDGEKVRTRRPSRVVDITGKRAKVLRK